MKFEFPEEFQNTILSLVVYSEDFLSQIRETLLPEYFDTREAWTICTLAYGYFDKYEKAPGTHILHEVGKYARKTKMKSEQAELVIELIDRLEPDAGPVEYVITELQQFIQHSQMRHVLDDFLPKYNAGNYNLDELIHSIGSVQKSFVTPPEMDGDFLSRTSRRTRERYMTREAEPVATLIDPLDEQMVGILPGQLGMILAPSGIGKTTFAVHLGKAAAMQGKVVFHYSLESPTKEIEDAYDRLLIHTSLDGLQDPNTSQDLLKAAKSLAGWGGKIYVFYVPEPSLDDLKALIQKHVKQYGMPGLIIIDYGECIEGPKAQKDTYIDAKIVWQGLKGVFVDLNVPGWLFSQAAIGAVGAKRITEQHRSDSYWKIRKSDIVLGFNRNMLYNEHKHKWEDEDVEHNADVVRLFVIKHRGRRDKYDLRFACDLDRGMIYSHAKTIQLRHDMEENAAVRIGAQVDVE